MKSGLVRPLTAAELKQTGGAKITKIGVRRRKKLMEVLSNAHLDGRRTVAGVTRQLQSEFGDKTRNWQQVAVTELTDARGKASFDLAMGVFGENAKVYRDVGANCCVKCCNLFGSVGRPRTWIAKKVPEEIKGAVHPNCDCGSWHSLERPDLTKAMDPASVLPMGIVKRRWNLAKLNYEALISTGNGYWTSLDSVTGRAIVGTMAMCVPVIRLRESMGFTVFVHGTGHFKKTPKVDLYDLRKLGSARFYPMDLQHLGGQELRNEGMRQVKSLTEYLSFLKSVMPSIATMPDYWDKVGQVRWLPDFFGFKTITDWIIVHPGEPSPESKITTINQRVTGLKMAMRKTTYAQLEGASLKKREY